MPVKLDVDATTGAKLLRLFQRLMADRRKHFQSDLADWLHCSKQTVIRLTREIEGVIGTQLRTGMEARRRWYQLCPANARSSLGLDFDELRFLRICRDMAQPYLPKQVRQRVDDSIFRFAMLLADASYAEDTRGQKSGFSFFSKGRIDYTPHFGHIDQLLRAQEEKLVCLVRYRAAGDGDVKEHRFAVGRMACMNNALYALGADVEEDWHTQRRMTSLAVHRILDVILTDKPVTFDIPEANPGMFGLPWHEPRTFRIRFRPGKVSDYVRERIWAEAQKLEEQEDGGVVLEITTCSEPELTAWVRSFGENANLLSAKTEEA